MQRTIRISQETYEKLNVLRNNLYPFQISFPKIIKVAADELESEVITNGKKKFQDKTKEKNRVTHDQKDILIAKLFKRIKQDEKSIRKGFEACKIWAENQKDWNKEFEREHKLIDCFANDIKLKHKKIKELEDLNKELTIMFGDKIDEYVKANQGLAKANNELTRAYEGLAHLGKTAQEMGIDIKKHYKNLPEYDKYDFSQKHELLESGKVRHTWTAKPKKRKG